MQFRIKRKKSIHEFSKPASHGPRLLVYGLGLLERISCGNIFTAFLAIRKEISAKIATVKFDLQCYNTYSLTNIVIYYVYEKQQGMDFSMNYTVTLVKSTI